MLSAYHLLDNLLIGVTSTPRKYTLFLNLKRALKKSSLSPLFLSLKLENEKLTFPLFLVLNTFSV